MRTIYAVFAVVNSSLAGLNLGFAVVEWMHELTNQAVLSFLTACFSAAVAWYMVYQRNRVPRS
jgi:hypothetical protein